MERRRRRKRRQTEWTAAQPMAVRLSSGKNKHAGMIGARLSVRPSVHPTDCPSLCVKLGRNRREMTLGHEGRPEEREVLFFFFFEDSASEPSAATTKGGKKMNESRLIDSPSPTPPPPPPPPPLPPPRPQLPRPSGEIHRGGRGAPSKQAQPSRTH